MINLSFWLTLHTVLKCFKMQISVSGPFPIKFRHCSCRGEITLLNVNFNSVASTYGLSVRERRRRSKFIPDSERSGRSACESGEFHVSHYFSFMYVIKAHGQRERLTTGKATESHRNQLFSVYPYENQDGVRR